MYDIIIVGGGPAGSTLARLIGRKYRVLLLEKRTLDTEPGSQRQKCCGGLIAPDAQLMLAKSGLGIPGSVILSPQLFAVRTIDIDNNIERYYQRFYINTDREQFDRWLLSIVPSEVHVICGAVFKSFSQKVDTVNVVFESNCRSYEESAKLLVGADGAFSSIRRHGFAGRPEPELYASIQEWFQTDVNPACYGAIFDREITDFYSWTIPKGEYLLLGSAIRPGADAVRRFEKLKGKLGKYGFDFSRFVKREGAYLARPVNIGQICEGGGRVALTGEAAGFISPSSAEGFSYAFRSSIELARALEKGIDGFEEVYSRNLRGLKRNILVKNLKSPAMYNRRLRYAVMKSGLQSINVQDY